MWNLILLILFIGITGVILFNTFHKENKQSRLLLISIFLTFILGIILITNEYRNNVQFDEEFHKLDIPSMYQVFESTGKKIFFVQIKTI